MEHCDKINSITCINIYGLLTMNNRVKPNILSDYLHSVNSLCLFLTETWLESDIEDGEVNI